MLCSGLVGFYIYGTKVVLIGSLGLSESFKISIPELYIVELFRLIRLALLASGILLVSYFYCRCCTL